MDTTDTKAAGYSLSVMSPASGDVRINAELFGNRTEIGGLSKNDLEAYVDFDYGVTDSIGYQTLPIRLRRKNGTVLKNATLSASSLEVKMDKIQSMELEVKEVFAPDITGGTESVSEIVIDKDNIEAEPKTVTVTGPSEELKQLEHVRVRLMDKEQIYQKKTYYGCSDFDLVGKDGTAVSMNNLKVQTQFNVTVPVYYLRKLPATLSFTNVPKNFDTNWLLGLLRLNTNRSYTLPQVVNDTLEIGEDNLEIQLKAKTAENKKKLEQRDTCDFGPVSLYDLNIQEMENGGKRPNIRAQLDLTDDLENVSKFNEVYVTVADGVDDTILDAVSFNIYNSDIQIINKRSGYDYSIAEGITTITICGAADEISQIQQSDIKAYANLYTATDSEQSTFTHALTLTLPENLNRIWVGEAATVTITAHQVSATATHT